MTDQPDQKPIQQPPEEEQTPWKQGEKPQRHQRGGAHRNASPAPILFVGGTGRSGTHIVSALLGRTRGYALIPVECRFHVERRGFPGLLAGEVTKKQFIKRLRGFWWKGFQTNRFRGLYRFVDREVFDAAVERFDAAFDSDHEAACRQLFFDLLWPRVEAGNAKGMIEQSCDVVAAAPTLVKLFPEAKFIHVARDGRDASASRVRQTRGLIYPRTRRQGLEWWEGRIRAIDRGARAISPENYLEIGLDDLLTKGRRRRLKRVTRFAGVFPGRFTMRYMNRRMSAEAANKERWRRGVSPSRQADIEQRYLDVLARLESDAITSAGLLRTSLNRAASGKDLEPFSVQIHGPGGKAEAEGQANGDDV
ncbi:hypothetical protein BH10ACT11_BH10ACT11_07880 [soil metagenome]